MRETSVMALDVVGFSKLMGDNAEATLETLSARRKIIHDIISTHNGRVFNEAGDSIVAEFPSNQAAATSAIEIQSEMSRLNMGSVAERRMLFRAGVNYGKVLESEGNVFGDTVNVAARLEAASSPEGVYISEIAHKTLDPELSEKFSYLGALSLKNIKYDVEVYVWTPDHQAGRYGSSDTVRVNEASMIPGSLAVLELKNLSSDEEQQYFCEGVSEELINTLSRYKSLRVTSSNASFAFSDKKYSPKEIGAALSVKYVLSGNVRSGANRVRIGIKLDNTETNQTIWSEKFDASKEDLWDLEENLAASVAYQIVGQVEADEIRSAANKPPENAGAYDLVLKGLKHHRNAGYSFEDSKKATALFNKALELDPNYPRALAWSVCSTAGLASWDPKSVAEDWLDKGIKQIEKALEIDPDDAESNRIMGSIQRSKGNFEVSIAHHKHAAELCPSDLYISSKLCEVLIYDGRLEEAQQELERAKEINPTGSDLLYTIEGILKFWQEDYASSRVLLGNLKMPSPVASIFMAAAEFHSGDTEASSQRVEKIERDYGLTVQKLFDGETYRLDNMKAKIAPIFPIRDVA
ncbi:putative integral membrane protein [Rhodobacteraceae bacterium HIMB11]|nr:putative integral membrane protein [Rhodobacteraceae bacterium HIMB11]